MTNWDWDVIVVGAGPAGLLSAARAAQRGRRTLLLEKNRKPGVKILMSGGTRCNLTQAVDTKEILAAFGVQGRFLHSCLAEFGPQALVDLIEAEGVPTKVEPGGKIFPQSDRALDVQEALLRRLKHSGAQLALAEPLSELTPLDDGFRLTTPVRTLTAQKVILTTGGRSYPGCGTSGDGYRWAEALGHTIRPTFPALVPATTAAPWVPLLKGITVPDVLVRVIPWDSPSASPGETAGKAGEILAQRRGSFLFAHFGLSGPAVLDVSRAISSRPRPRKLALSCDFLPDMPEARFETELRHACAADGKRQVLGILGQWLPNRLAETLLAQAGVAVGQRAAELSKAHSRRILLAVKQQVIPVTGTLGFEKAEVTTGGVALEEVDSRTMQSKRLANLYFAGELLDLDGPIGGYNFQAAFATGWRAGGEV